MRQMTRNVANAKPTASRPPSLPRERLVKPSSPDPVPHRASLAELREAAHAAPMRSMVRLALSKSATTRPGTRAVARINGWCNMIARAPDHTETPRRRRRRFPDRLAQMPDLLAQLGRVFPTPSRPRHASSPIKQRHPSRSKVICWPADLETYAPSNDAPPRREVPGMAHCSDRPHRRPPG